MAFYISHSVSAWAVDVIAASDAAIVVLNVGTNVIIFTTPKMDLSSGSSVLYQDIDLNWINCIIANGKKTALDFNMCISVIIQHLYLFILFCWSFIHMWKEYLEVHTYPLMCVILQKCATDVWYWLSKNVLHSIELHL